MARLKINDERKKRDIEKICAESEIGFNSNISNTEDKMAWKNTQKKIYEFMTDIVARSYISDESFMGAYIDYYYYSLWSLCSL